VPVAKLLTKKEIAAINVKANTEGVIIKKIHSVPQVTWVRTVILT